VAHGLTSSGDGSLVASTVLRCSAALLSPWGGEGGGGSEEACGIPDGGEEDKDRGREVQGGWMRLSAGGRKRGAAALVAGTRTGSQGWGASSGVACDGDGRGTDDRATDDPPSCFEGGGLSSRPPSIAADPWTAMARTVGIKVEE